MSRKTIQSINWSALAERIPEKEKTMFAAFKAKSDQYLRRMTANPEASPKIDWAYYRKQIVTPGLVDGFQREYEKLTIPYPADKYTELIETEQGKVMQKIEERVQTANKVISECEATIVNIKDLLPFSQMTLEELTEIHPELSIDVENPTAWPHTDDCQPGMEGDAKSAH